MSVCRQTRLQGQLHHITLPPVVISRGTLRCTSALQYASLNLDSLQGFSGGIRCSAKFASGSGRCLCSSGHEWQPACGMPQSQPQQHLQVQGWWVHEEQAPRSAGCTRAVWHTGSTAAASLDWTPVRGMPESCCCAGPIENIAAVILATCGLETRTVVQHFGASRLHHCTR